MLLLALCTLALALLIGWAFVTGWGSPRPQAEIVGPVPVFGAKRALRDLLIEERIGMSIMRPESFVKITSVT